MQLFAALRTMAVGPRMNICIVSQRKTSALSGLWEILQTQKWVHAAQHAWNCTAECIVPDFCSALPRSCVAAVIKGNEGRDFR